MSDSDDETRPGWQVLVVGLLGPPVTPTPGRDRSATGRHTSDLAYDQRIRKQTHSHRVLEFSTSSILFIDLCFFDLVEANVL